ncbi:hypothetical protein LJY25_08130 [Hymenobacter sp. BT175]|uniref:DUF6712 family protein n=1 Tax=Hymenobacter translucens TaxID=2886507 RepID=UPI001D0E47B4|nr:DUF6712 family protein [Hymenobacter translucens]MCC2546409.1 hypothetical protein [Hymenobacter translucens]
MLFSTTEELKEALGSTHKNLNFETVKSFVDQAETVHLVPAVGFELLAELSAGDEELNEAQKALRKHLRAALGYYAVLESAPFLAVSMGELGMMEAQTQNMTGARQWVYNNFVQAAAGNGDKMLDVALTWLEFKATDFPTWTSSEAYQSSQELFISGAHVLGKYIGIGDSRRTFLAMLPALRRVEDLNLRPLLGDEACDELKARIVGRTTTPADKKMLDLLRPALAHLGLSSALPELSIAITGSGFRLLSDNDSIRQSQAAPAERVAALSRSEASIGTSYIERLKRHLDALHPEEESSAASLYDNAGKPSFVV